MKKGLTLLMIVALLASSIFANGAQEVSASADDGLNGYPNKTVEFIVPAAAGASLDLYTRALNEVLDLGTPMKISNMAGASQTIGMMELAARPADGYSMGIVAFAGGVIQPQLNQLTYDNTSFRPIATLSGPNKYAICAKADSEIKDYDSFVAAISSGSVIHWTAPNSGSPAHLAGLYYLNTIENANCEFVAYNGSANAMSALLAGDIDFYVTDDSEVATRLENAQVSSIVVLSEGRSASIPDTPSIDEMGIPGMGVFDGFSWVQVPKGTPDAIYNYIKERIDAAATSDSYNQFLDSIKSPRQKTYTEAELTNMINGSYQAIGETLTLINK